MIIRFLSSSDKTMIWSKCSELKGTDIWLKHDFPASVEQKKKTRFPILKEALRQGKKATLVEDRRQGYSGN